MKTLLLFANAFPFGSWEPYLETELPYLTDFDEVRVFSLSVREDQARTRRPVRHPHATVHPLRFRSRLFYLVAALRVLLDVELYREVRVLWNQRRLSPGRLVQLFVFLSRCHHEARAITSMIRKENLVAADADVVLYSYRLAYQPYLSELVARSLAPRRSVRVARAHRADLYEELAPNGYIPMRKRTLDSLDDIILIAKHGYDYLASRFPEALDRMRISYLGSIDRGVGPSPADRETLRILTCSNVVPVKRLDRLVDALALISDISVSWTHFGDGPLMDGLRDSVKSLPGNVEVHLPGAVTNVALLEHYATTPYHVLVNVSESEGIPVSMMEANSFGIPIIATDVGGVGEIVETGVNGILLASEPSFDELADAIRKIAEMDYEDYASLRSGARRVWRAKFDAATNYPRFGRELLETLNAASTSVDS
ncbi:glycosyltransferase [Tessaracoccus oleiagri]|uniref:Glycosyltransferase involved in cell wall bisynthesis n=1 Tax=Tessaracoccus oleiagri TaxID=686624 RepID=A0A1G9KFG5_9ACTN|nr:glycosyltransferase [Tessaracoccus oleiagri]SDL48548.1 Glycosyltransferase involved in cell wall bisynthesis [Tessaracoccus oleiagri]